MDKKRIILNRTAVAVASPAQKKMSRLKGLISIFSGNIDQYQSKNYDEAKTRVDFIDKFFELLDWDLSNKQGFSEEYRDVIREDKVRIEGKQKAPDYCFKIGMERKFFVEAKKPSVNIKEDIGAAYQLRRYAYSAKLPLSILTDFHEFAVYDTRIKPRPNDNASVARIFYCQFDEYEQNFDFIYNTFSKSAILKGSFDRYVASSKNKKGTSEVDKEILKLIESWRSDLAKNIASNNKRLDLYNLNTAVQKIIDRIIFLRIAEDRNIEEYNNLGKIAADGNIYKKLDGYFQLADKRYNSGLFAIENWLSNLKIDDKILKDIIKSTYFPESPYEFSVLPVEILGNIYEQFLGKVIRLTASHEAKIEEKPEVKKAGGVYYTPQYIVDYIVKNTVGEKIKDSTPEKIEKIKILDPACGSGSFLLGAYGYLLRWHLDYYTRDKNSLLKYKKGGKIYDYKGDFKLTIDEKKKILKNNIFGVDIDSQAVEVTKLSLLLKLMEDETQQSAGMLIKYSHEALLPDLEHNIKCGNSLIGPDFYEGKNMSLFGNDEMRKVNVFDWQKEFKDIFANGGFDVVIGNPPYRREKDYKELLAEIKNSSFGERYYEGKMDLWYFFLHKALDVSKKDRLISFIVNSYWLSGAGARKLIKRLKAENLIEEIFYLNSAKIFQHVSGRHLIFKLSKLNTKVKIIRMKKEGNIDGKYLFNSDSEIESYDKLSKNLYDMDRINIERDDEILGKINRLDHLEHFTKIRQGIAENPHSVGKKKIEQYKLNAKSGDGVFVINSKEKDILKLNNQELGYLRPYFETNEMDRYFISKHTNKSILYLTPKNCDNINKFPNIRNHLLRFKPIMDERRETKNGRIPWYCLHWPREEEIFKEEKILSIQMARRPLFIYSDNINFVGFDINIILSDKIDLKFLCGVLNSKLLWYWFNNYAKKRGVGLEINQTVLKNAPIKVLNLTNKEQELHNKIILLVEQMLEVQKKYHSAKTESDKKLYQQKIEILDKQIDGEVYGLYGLSEEEIKIVEGK